MKVPYAPVPTVAPENTPTPNVNVQVNPEAFGIGVSSALEGFGQHIEHAGDTIFKRAIAIQDVLNDTEAKEADSKYMIDSAPIHAQFNSLQGLDAQKAQPKYHEDLNNLRLNIRSGLSNDDARKRYDSSSIPFMGRNIFNGAGYAASQTKVAANQAAGAQIQLNQNNVEQNPSDERTYQAAVAAVRTNTLTQAGIGGWDQPVIDEKMAQGISGVVLSRITGLSKSEPMKAKDTLDKDRELLFGNDIKKAEDLVHNGLVQSQSRIIADKVLTPLKNNPEDVGKSLEQMLDQGEAEAKKIMPNDPQFIDATRSRITAQYNSMKASKREDDIGIRNVISSALMGENNPGGKLPTTVEELTADPAAEAAWQKLDARGRQGYMKALERNAKGDVRMNEPRFKRWTELKGLAQSDPEEFLGVNMGDEDLPIKTKQEFVKQQIAMKGKAEGDPRVTHALSVLRPILSAANMDPSKDKELYNQFVGSLQDSLDRFQQDNKKLPKAEDINLIGARLLQQTSSPEFWYGKDYFFNLPVPKPTENEIKLRPIWAEQGREPTDYDVKRVYVREQYQKLYGGAKKSEGPKVPKQ